MGAEVTIISGPVHIQAAQGIRVISVTSAKEMYEAAMQEKKDADIIVAAAAVSDYTPIHVAEHKMKKDNSLSIELKKTKDILKELGKNKTYHLVGFAAETHDLAKYAQQKLHNKNLDMIVANDVSRKDAGFDSDYNIVTMFKSTGEMIRTDRETKDRIADRIMQEIEKDIV